MRGFPVRSFPHRKASISTEEEDHLPYLMTNLNKAAARPIAPIECVPCPQSAFRTKWDCDRDELKEKLRAFSVALIDDKIEA